MQSTATSSRDSNNMISYRSSTWGGHQNYAHGEPSRCIRRYRPFNSAYTPLNKAEYARITGLTGPTETSHGADTGNITDATTSGASGSGTGQATPNTQYSSTFETGDAPPIVAGPRQEDRGIHQPRPLRRRDVERPAILNITCSEDISAYFNDKKPAAQLAVARRKTYRPAPRKRDSEVNVPPQTDYDGPSSDAARREMRVHSCHEPVTGQKWGMVRQAVRDQELGLRHERMRDAAQLFGSR